MIKNIKKIYEELESWFFGFWVTRWKFTFLFSFLLVGLWIYSAAILPKESSPDIEFGIIQVTTVYLGVNPQDIDTLITQKIEQEIEDIMGIKKITSTSSIGVSSTTVELENDVDTSKILTEIKDGVDKAQLPSDAEDPIVTEVSTDSERMFEVLLYGPADIFTSAYLKERARTIKADLEWKWVVSRIDIGWWSDYEVRVVVDANRAQQLWLRTSDISNAIRNNNANQPLGNHRIDDLNYTFRIQGEIESEQDILNTPIVTSKGVITLWSLATVTRYYDDNRVTRMWSYQKSGYNFVTLWFNKKKWANIFTSSDNAKQSLESLLQTQAYQGLDISYTQDIADYVREDYQSLASNGLQTIFLVFFAILLFVGMKESVIASMTIPLAFLITFMVLNQLGLSLNFLTNFSLIICFGIAIDTTIVIIEWAHEKMRMWFDPKSAVLFAVRDYKRPLITGTTTTCVVFLPMLALPGITGKFLAYIPITIFTTLIAALFISLTINSALYYKLSKKNRQFERKADENDYLTQEEILILKEEREGKTEKNTQTLSRREKILDRMSQKYSDRLWRIMHNKKTRLISILAPIWLLILSFIFISPQLGFTLFPSGDNPFISIEILWQEWATTESMLPYVDTIDASMAAIPEIKSYSYTVKDNAINLNVELLKKDEREDLWLRDSFAVEETINESLAVLTSQWITVATKVQAWWPPTGKAVWVKLIADSNEKFDTLLAVAKDFEAYLNTLTWSKNVVNSSSQSPGQFVFTLDKEKLAIMWLLPTEISSELFISLNGMWAGTVKWRYDNYDITIRYDNFIDGVSPSDVMDIRVPTRLWSITLWTVADYRFENAITNISREDGNITVKIESDIEPWLTPDVVQVPFAEFAQSYQYPDGISYQEWWETQENADLIQAMWVAFLVSIMLIYAILVLQFNSFLQPAIIMYSIVMWLLWTNIWLWVTGNPYSMAFGIGFIALTGIVVNDAIVFIDRANNNKKRWMSIYDSVVETGKARLQPIILTTITTVLWLSSVARQDEFFAWLAYTIMFWLATASAMTLLVIPALYHDQDKLIHSIKRSIIAWVVFMSIPFAVIAAIYVVALMFNLWFITGNIGPIFSVLLLVYIVAYIVYIIHTNTTKEPNIIEKTIWLQVVQDDGQPLTRTLAIRRFVYKRWSMIGPMVLWSLIHPALWWLLFFAVLMAHFTHAWLDENQKTWYDKRLWTKTISL